jgi:hypothetical protein
MRNPIIAALDVPTAEAALELVKEIAPVVGAFKIGSELFTSAGPDIVRRIRATGAAVFLDLKFHDIPNTVAKAVAVGGAIGRANAHRACQRRSGHDAKRRRNRPQQETAQQTRSQCAAAGARRDRAYKPYQPVVKRNRSLIRTSPARCAGSRTWPSKPACAVSVCSPLEVAELRQRLTAGTTTRHARRPHRNAGKGR